jgi:hypothetical protein
MTFASTVNFSWRIAGLALHEWLVIALKVAQPPQRFPLSSGL